MGKRWAWIAGVLLVASPLMAQNCAGLSKLGSATVLIAKADVSTGSGPSYCRVVATLRPTADSEIGIEVWLPVAAWNGKLMAVGSGGWGGTIATGAMSEALKRGYATASTDDGHIGGSGSFVVGHPEKLIDFAYRAEHEMTLEAKALIKAFYGSDAKYSYWNGCSGGGREGLLQAARYPDEFDGIIAGDPANIRRNAWALWLANETFKDADAVIPAAKYAMVHRFVLNACDANDGLKDGLIGDPESCHPDFKALECKQGDGPDCLTTRQVRTAQTIVSAPKTSTGAELFPRLEPGTEMRWARLAGGPAPAELFLDELRYVVYADAKWDWRTFDLDRDAAKAHAIDRNVDEMDPNLAAFAKHGKLLIYHGWADQQVAPGSSVEFFEATKKDSGNADFVRLFMAPGMGHCSGGEGPDAFDKIGALEQWVEQGKAPERIVASHKSDGKVDRTRPLCPYPQMAKYKGTGSVDDAANFVCAAK